MSLLDNGLDYSGLLASAQRTSQVPVQGMSAIGDALDAIMVRRERQKQQALENERLRQADALKASMFGEDVRHNKATEKQAADTLGNTSQHEKDALHATAHAKAVAAAQLGNLEEATALDPEHFGGHALETPSPPSAPAAAAPTATDSAPAQAGVEPPALSPGGGPPVADRFVPPPDLPLPRLQQPMAGPPAGGAERFVPPPDLAPLLRGGAGAAPVASMASAPPAAAGARPAATDLGSAIYAGTQARAAKELASWQADMKPFVGNDPLKRDAYDYATKAGGHLGSRETLDKIFAERLTHLENNRTQLQASNQRASSFAGPDEREAKMIIPEITDAVKPVRAKGGIKDQVIHSQAAIEALQQNPNNPVSWVNAIDSMIRTNTGKAAIKQQYDLYVAHSHGQADNLETFVDKLKTGLPSPEQQKNLFGALKASNAELRDLANQEHKNFRATYDSDPRVQNNPLVKRHYDALERTTFGTMPGYGQAPQVPPGAVMGSMGGKRGYVLNGKFVPLEGGQ